MAININSVGFSASSALEEFIQKKFSKLDKFYDGIVGFDVNLKLEKDDDAENKVVEVSVDIKGQNVFVRKNARTFEEAVDQLCDVLKRQLTKLKEQR